MAADSTKLAVPKHSVYFSQLQPMRWLRTPGVNRFETLWTEILAHALLFKHLVVQDSHLVQNYELFSRHRNWKYEYWLQALFSEQIFVVARRKDSDFYEITVDQVRRGVPSFWNQKEQPLPAEAVPYARLLDEWSKGAVVAEWTVPALRDHFQATCTDDVLDDANLIASLGLDIRAADRLRLEIARLDEEGNLSAQEIYDLSGWKRQTYSKDPVLEEQSESVRVLATWLHNLHFPVLFNLPITFSPVSVDSAASEQYLAKFIPQLEAPKSDESAVRALESHFRGGEALARGFGTSILLDKGIEPILRLREKEEFERLQIARGAYVDSLRGQSDDVQQYLEELDDSMLWYAARIAEEYPELLADKKQFTQVASVLFRTAIELADRPAKEAAKSGLFIGFSTMSTLIGALGMPPILSTVGIALGTVSGAAAVVNTVGMVRDRRKLRRVDQAQRVFAIIESKWKPSAASVGGRQSAP